MQGCGTAQGCPCSVCVDNTRYYYYTITPMPLTTIQEVLASVVALLSAVASLIQLGEWWQAYKKNSVAFQENLRYMFRPSSAQ